MRHKNITWISENFDFLPKIEEKNSKKNLKILKKFKKCSKKIRFREGNIDFLDAFRYQNQAKPETPGDTPGKEILEYRAFSKVSPGKPVYPQKTQAYKKKNEFSNLSFSSRARKTPETPETPETPTNSVHFQDLGNGDTSETPGDTQNGK